MKPVRQFDLDNHFLKEYPSAKDAASATGIDRTNIVKCLTGTYHTAGGYVWRYKAK